MKQESLSALRTIERLKKDATELKKALRITHTVALNQIAQQKGYKNWQILLKEYPEQESITTIVSPAPIAPLYPLINEELIRHNRELLTKLGLDHSTLVITATGIEKSIMDAVVPLRDFFMLNEYHDYSSQVQGIIEKKPAKLVTESKVIDTEVSLYRPKTKQGDPRIWVYKLKPHVQPNDTLALILVEGLLYVFNISQIDLNTQLKLLQSLVVQSNAIAQELLEKLRVIAKAGPLKAIKTGDTAIGMTIEAALGIEANSSKNPDYKGIELKSARKRKKPGRNRYTLFAQVADWEISPLKSSAEVINAYGYTRGDSSKLNCTITTKTFNSQGLKFDCRLNEDLLAEFHQINGDILYWTGHKLRSRLAEKHKETFWINAEPVFIGGTEHFILKSIVHTKNPLINQFMQLIYDGIITMDHASHRYPDGKLKERGPLFKILPKDLKLLFPEQKEYLLD